MTGLDRETRAAIEALVRRLRDRDPGADDEVFAREFIITLRGHGWRPTEAKAVPAWQRPRIHGKPPTGGYLAARAELDARLARDDPDSAA
jgi:hypothetical protein